MRVFYALTFDNKTKEKISHYRDLVANHSLTGRFIDTSNLHLTLEFIGDVKNDELNTLMDILDTLTLSPLVLRGSYLGLFKRKNKDIIWLGINKSQQVNNILKELRAQLTSNNYKLEDSKQIPHITLGRQVILLENLEDYKVNPIDLPVKSIALMVSKRVQDILVYEPIYEIEL